MIAIQIPSIEYKTISYSRILSVDMPFANAHRGVPYGEKNGPMAAIAMIGAAGSVSAGIAAGGLLGGIMIAGGIASGLGVLTGNKTLSTIGAVAGLAGFGVGSFTSVDGGGFMNPFSSAADGSSNFFNSVSGSAVKSVFDNIKGGLGITDGAAAAGIKDTAGVANMAGESAASAGGNLMSSGADQLQYVDGVSTSALGRTVDAASSAGGGLLNALNGSSGMVNGLGGLAQGYMKGQELEQLQPLRDSQVAGNNAQTAAQQQQTDILNQRQENMKYQPTNMPTVNQNHNVYNGQPGTTQPGKIAVSIGGEVKYVSAEEYNQMQQAKAGTGMLSQMEAA